MRREGGGHRTRPDMKKAALLLPLFLLLCCGANNTDQTLSVEHGKKFDKLTFKKIWQADLYGGWCLAMPQGIVCSELQDKSYKESHLSLHDYSGRLVKERRLVHGDGPNEIRVWNFFSVWPSTSGKVLTEDNDYLKSLDPETLEIETICKLSNVIRGFGAKYTLGRQSYSTPEENAGRTVTSLESAGFFEDMTHYIVIYDGVFNNLHMLTKAVMTRPLDWQKLRERKRRNGRLETLRDYYQMLRKTRTLTVDWKRGVVYFFSDIEKPEIESVSFDGQVRKKYLIDIRPEDFKVDREELDFYREYASSAETDASLKALTIDTFYIPANAPALMGLKVMGDRLLIITGNRNAPRKENEVLVYGLPSLMYEGSFYMPYSNIQQTLWYDGYYITRTQIKKDDDYYYTHDIYRVEEK